MNKFSKYSDKKVLELIRIGEDTDMAFFEIYNRHSNAVKAYCKCMIQNAVQAEEIFQETFISFFNNIKAGKEIENVPAYLIGTTRNLSFNYRRDRKTTVPVGVDDLIVDERNVYEKEELFDLVVRSLELLELKYREPFVLREFNGMPFKEIAEICDISESGAKSRVQRAHKQILKILSPYIKDLEKNKSVK